MPRSDRLWPAGLLAASALLTFFTVYDQVFHRTGVQFILGDQLDRHRAVLAGTAIDPWQYRLLSEVVIEATIRTLRWLGADEPALVGFIAVRAVQNLAIFILTAAYWQSLGVRRLHALIGLTAMAWGFSYSGYASDLSFSTYFDLLFYLVAAWLTVRGKPRAVLPVVALAALNRETAGLIPVMLAASTFSHSRGSKRRHLVVAASAMLIFLVEYAALRYYFGARSTMQPHGHRLGVELLELNLTWVYTYFSAVASFSLIPWLALLFWRRWPQLLKSFFWAIVPVWLLVHLFLGAIAEARLLLVPYVIVLLPAALLVIQREGGTPPDDGQGATSELSLKAAD